MMIIFARSALTQLWKIASDVSTANIIFTTTATKPIVLNGRVLPLDQLSVADSVV